MNKNKWDILIDMDNDLEYLEYITNQLDYERRIKKCITNKTHNIELNGNNHSFRCNTCNYEVIIK